MSPVVFLDANVPIYASGRAHPLKQPCGQVLSLAARHAASFVTDAEVLQELLHRYGALRTWSKGQEAFFNFCDLMRGRVEAVRPGDVERAATLADSQPNLSARDLVHLAVMLRLGVRHIVSADAGFDGLPDVERLDPARWESWPDLALA